jgi:pimeloyl-ACP methyl ester carboxylesterase
VFKLLLQDQRIVRRTSDVSFLDRTFRSRSLRRHVSESDSEAFGPTGLTTIYTPSSETLVEIIFVHGLRGGSRQAWSFSPHIMHFWPKEWLPEHPDFEHARIHTYGYPSDWMLRRENPSSIHDFGLGLLEAMLNSPELRQAKITKIILVAHSMGGLVVKKSIITARHNPMFQELCDRFQAAFFFGTPHRGSDLASTLNKYLRATMNTPKPFVTDLLRGSDTTNLLNEEFRHVYQGMSLYSFVETVPMTWHVGSGLIVERDSAVMGKILSSRK